MKAAVITLHTVCNYGTQLQVYATQEKLKQYFDDVVFIDYRRPDTYGKELLKTYAKGNPLRALAFFPTMLRWKKVFGDFLKNNINLSNEVYLKDEDFDNFIDIADVYFSGSDQVWNTGWNSGIIPAFYLSFVPDNKPRYAYSSSFGKTEFTKNEISNTKKYIDKFSAISVRESSALSILTEKYGYKNCINLLDPTLAITADFWRELMPRNRIKEDYILIYNLNRNKEFDKYADLVAKYTGYKLYRFCTRFDQIVKNGKSIMIPNIFEFITLIDNAKLVITDSFHATAFSVNLGTDFVCVYPKDYSSRLSDFLNLMDIKERNIKNYNDLEVIERHIDFQKTIVENY